MNNTTHHMLYRLPYGKFLKEDTEALETMKRAGIRLISISPMHTSNAFGEPYSCYPPIWKYDESYDFSSLDRHIGDVLDVIPDARFICAVDLNSPLWLARRFSLDSFYSLNACALHPEWLVLTTKFLNAFLEYTESKYGDRMAGYVLACGRTMEWINHNCYEADGLKSGYYAEWCRKQGLPHRPIPDSRELKSARHGFIRDPGQEAHVIQWLRYANSLIADLVIHFVSAARKKVRQEAEIGLFYGSVFHMMADAQHECERVFDTAPPDFMIGASCNSTRDMGNTSGYIATLHMLKRRGIRYLHECDRITSTTNRKLSDFITVEGAIWNAWRNPQEDVAGLRREMCLSIINRFHLWWFNIWGHSYASPEVKQEMALLKSVWDRYAPLSTGSSAEILLVHDPESNYHVNFYDHPRQYFLAHELRNVFSRAGLPFDTAAWNDLAHIDLKQYRMVIFQNAVIQSAERDAVFAKVCGDSRLIVWIHAPGILRNGVYDPANVTRLTGYTFGESDFAVRDHGTFRSVYAAEGEELTDERLRSLAEEAGVHCVCPPGTAVWQSAEFLMLHRGTAAEIPVVLPRKAHTVTEVFRGRCIARDTDRFTAGFSGAETMLFHIQ